MSRDIVLLDNHALDVKPTDLVLIAVSNGKSYSVTLKDADITSLDDELMFSLREYALREELSERIRFGNAA